MNPSDSTSRRRQGMDYGDSEDVQKVHAAIQREKQEPRVGLEPLSIVADRNLRSRDFLRRRLSRPLLRKL